MRRPRLLFYIQHLLGIGHLVRGARIAAAAAAGPFDVTVVLGGARSPGIAFGSASVWELPPIKAGPAGFATLVGPDGRPLDDALRAERRERLLAAFDEVSPDVLLIEAFPFGRRAMRFELLPLLEKAAACRPRPLIASSIRDILQEARSPARIAETVALVRERFDCVLVHGDPRLVPLGDSFPAVDVIADRLRYTGLVGPGAGDADADPSPAREVFDVVVSVGGGAVGADLITAALAAKPISRMNAASWLVLTGPNLPPGVIPSPMPGVTMRPFVTDLPARLRDARLSISQAGYNTVADLLEAPRCRAVLVPYVGQGETEQTHRAKLMARAGLAVNVSPEGLDGTVMARAIDDALEMPQANLTVERDGARRGATLLAAALGEHRRRLA